MGEFLVASQQPSQGGSSSSHYAEFVVGPHSPSSERYKLKQAFLQEKWEIVEAQNNMLRKRVQEVRKEVEKELDMRRTLCNLLEEKGDQWYKKALYVDKNEPLNSAVDTSLFTDIGLLRNEPVDVAPKKKSRPSKSRAKVQAAKVKEQLISAEQKAEEERAKAKIVSIIDSVFTETAKKSKKLKEEMKSKVASVTKDVAGKRVQSVAHVTLAHLRPPTSKASAAPPLSTRKVSPQLKNTRRTANQKKDSHQIPYKILNNPTDSVREIEEGIGGVIDGIKFTYIPHESPPQYSDSNYFVFPPVNNLASEFANDISPTNSSLFEPSNFPLNPPRRK